MVLAQGSHQHPRLRIFLYNLLVSLPKIFILVVLQSVLKRKLLNFVIVIDLFLDLGEQSGDSVVFGPEVGLEFRKYQCSIYENLKGTEPGEVYYFFLLVVEVLCFSF